MAQLRADLLLSLTDRLTGPIGKTGRALKAAERQVAAFKRASASGVRQNMISDLQKVGASSSQIDRVTRAWERYRRSAGLAADSSKWTKAQIAQVKTWERANINALKNVNAARPKGRMAASDGSGLSAGHGALIGAAASRLGLSASVAPVAIAAGSAYALNRATKNALTFEEVMYEVEKATDSSGEAAQRYAAAVLKMATETGKTSTELGGILASAGFAGRPKEELLDFTRYAAMATGAWGTSAEATGQALAEIGNIYQANQKRIEEIGDAINSVADSSASKETDLLDFLRRSGAQAKILGISAEQTLAYGAALKEVGVQSEVAATGFNALLTKLSTGAEDDDWNDELKKLGINTKAFTATLKKDAPAAISILLASINKISDGTKKMAVLKDLFGAEYADDIARLAGNLGGVDKMLALVARRPNYLGSVSKSFELLKEKDFNRLARFNAQMERFSITVGGPLKTALGAAADQASRLFESFQEGGAGAKAVDALNAAAKRYVNDQAARQELKTGTRYDYDADSRREIDARKALLESQAFDEKLAKYDREMAVAAKLYDWSKPRGKSAFNDQMEDALGRIKDKRDGLVSARRARDRASIELIENEAAQKAARTRMGLGMTGTPTPITPGLSSFGFGLHGSNQPQQAPGPTTAPLPPTRPVELDKAPKMLERFEQIFQSGVEISASSVAAMKQPSGTQDVRITNPPPAPSVPVTVNVTVNATTNASASDIASAVSKQVGARTKAVLQGSHSDAAN
ncbi:MAG: phage tail tape measure protein [Bosea sp. (in: a-proteobacteria)]|nr:phage tail tape measure protein [Bosea sp. (in: a-proteobacteria)]